MRGHLYHIGCACTCALVPCAWLSIGNLLLMERVIVKGHALFSCEGVHHMVIVIKYISWKMSSQEMSLPDLKKDVITINAQWAKQVLNVYFCSSRMYEHTAMKCEKPQKTVTLLYT